MQTTGERTESFLFLFPPLFLNFLKKTVYTLTPAELFKTFYSWHNLLSTERNLSYCTVLLMLFGTTQNENCTPFFTKESVLADKNIKVCTVFLRQTTLQWRKCFQSTAHAYRQEKLSTACSGSVRGKLMQIFQRKNRPTSNRSI